MTLVSVLSGALVPGGISYGKLVPEDTPDKDGLFDVYTKA